MKQITTLLTGILAIFAAGLLFADTLELADGTLLEGDFVGSSNGIVMFNTGDSIEAFPESEVVGIFLSAGVDTAAQLMNAPAIGTVTVPAGTRLIIRTTDSIDSRQHGVGHRFRGQLEGSIVIGGVTVAPRGTFVHGRIAQAQQARRATGRSELAVEFTDIVIDDQFFPIATGGLSAQGQSEAGRTVGRTARAAAVGGLIGGSSGARTGAQVGAGVSILTAGASVNIPRGTIVETSLTAALTLPVD